MIRTIKIRERGPTPRRFAKVFTAAKREGWLDSARHFHSRLRDKRFTEEHARRARYRRRSRKYNERKQRIFGHRNPLEYSGETRRMVRMARVTSTTKSGRASYPGARKLNLRNPRSQIHMAEEFRRITAPEARELAKVFDGTIDRQMARDTTTTTKTVT